MFAISRRDKLFISDAFNDIAKTGSKAAIAIFGTVMIFTSSDTFREMFWKTTAAVSAAALAFVLIS